MRLLRAGNAPLVLSVLGSEQLLLGPRNDN